MRRAQIRAFVREHSPTPEAMKRIEADPGFQQMMKETEQAIREGRLYTTEEVEQMLAQRRHCGKPRKSVRQIIEEFRARASR
jgi:bacterioferritin-associated ferredoxin